MSDAGEKKKALWQLRQRAFREPGRGGETWIELFLRAVWEAGRGLAR